MTTRLMIAPPATSQANSNAANSKGLTPARRTTEICVVNPGATLSAQDCIDTTAAVSAILSGLKTANQLVACMAIDPAHIIQEHADSVGVGLPAML